MNVSETNRDGVDVLVLEGEADLAAVPSIQEKLRERREAASRHLVMDFSGTTFVNTPVWALVVEYFQHARESGSGFALAGLQGRVLSSFELMRLGDFIDHFATVDEAVAAAPAGPGPGASPPPSAP